MPNQTIKSYRDLKAYNNLYDAQIKILTEIVPKLPKEEISDLASQMRRACKAPPALIAEGFAKRYQKKNWKKYLNDALGESYEMINHLQVCVDVYSKYVNIILCQELIKIYDKSGGQLYKLKEVWQNFHDNRN